MSELSVIRVGSFSGSGTSIRDALAARVGVVDFDFISVARRPAMWWPRIAALVEAARVDGKIPYSKTASWSRGLQAVLPAALLDRPVLFIQSTPALDLPAGIRYAIYTDRLGREGLAASGAFRSQATPEWILREQRFVERAHRLFVMGPTTREFAIAEYGLSPEQVIVVGGAPNARLGPHRQSDRCDRLLFVGIDWRRKGLPDLFEAFVRVSADHPSLRLDVVGAVPDIPIPPGVEVAGRVPHDGMAQYFARADLLVIPTHTEPFGIALVEALMMGIPVIGSTVGNQEWIIGHGGLAVAPGRPGELADAIMKMVDEYPIMKQRADARRTELLETMTWERIAQRVLAELLDESPEQP